jgi:hypothetical protein
MSNTIAGSQARVHYTSRKKRIHLPKLRHSEHIDFLSLLGKAKGKRLRERLLELASKNQIDAVLECIDNIDNNIVPVPKQNVKKLQRYTPIVRKLRVPRTSLRRKKALLKQSGGMVMKIIPLVLECIQSALGKLLM